MNSALLKMCLALGLIQCLSSHAMPNDPIRQEVASSRSYVGGPDEDDLRVQPQTLTPIRRLDAKALQIQVLKTSGRADAVEEAPQGE